MLPADILKQTALALPFEDVLSFCQTSKVHAKVCDDNYFWRDKLHRDYPELPLEYINGFPIDKMKTIYYTEKRKELTGYLGKYTYDYYIIQGLVEEKSRLQQKLYANAPEDMTLFPRYLARHEKKIDDIRRELEITRRKAEQKESDMRALIKYLDRMQPVGDLFDSHYREIKLPPEAFTLLEEAFWSEDGYTQEVPVNKLQDFLQDVTGDPIVLNEGDLIGLTGARDQDHKIKMLAFVSNNYGRVYVEIADLDVFTDALDSIDDYMYKHSMSKEEFKSKYHYPYNWGLPEGYTADLEEVEEDLEEDT